MRRFYRDSKAAKLAGIAAGLGLAIATAAWAQSTPQQSTPPSTPSAAPTAQQQPDASQPTPSTPSTQSQPAPGTAPVAGDTQASKPAPGTTPVDGDKAPSKPAPGTEPVKGDVAAAAVNPDKVVDVGSERIKVKPGSIEDVSAVGNRDIGGRGMGNWYSTDTEIKMGKSYASEIEKSTKFITDPTVTEYVNRIGQNLVKNSDCKVPFTIRVIDSDEINAMALPGGFFFVNSGLILNADEEAELAGVMAHEIAHVCAHHAVREQTRMNYAQLGTIPLIMMTG